MVDLEALQDKFNKSIKKKHKRKSKSILCAIAIIPRGSGNVIKSFNGYGISRKKNNVGKMFGQIGGIK